MKQYSIRTYCFRLYEKHIDWFQKTKEIYSGVVGFYLSVLLKEFPGLEASGRELLRKMEILTLGEKRKGIEPVICFPYEKEKIPLYFRRAAINEAIAAARSYQTRHRAWEKKKNKMAEPGIPENLQVNPVFYKGMYRNLHGNCLELKLFDGQKWRWAEYRLHMGSRVVPENAKLLSPKLVIKQGQAYLHIPVQVEYDALPQDSRDWKAYMAVAFPMGDIFAAYVIFSAAFEEKSAQLLRGGRKFLKERRELEERLYTRQKNGASLEAQEKCREQLRQLSNGYAHRISHQLLRLAKECGCSTIVVPNYRGTLQMNKNSRYLVSPYDWLGSKICRYLEYKAPEEKLRLVRVSNNNISKVCSLCGAPVKRYSDKDTQHEPYESRRLYVCQNGHRGNAAINTARNTGHRFQEVYGEFQTEFPTAFIEI